MTHGRHSKRPSAPRSSATGRQGERPSASNNIALSLRELRTEPGVYAYDAWKNVSIGVWVGQATLPAVRRLLDMSSEMARAHPDGRSSVVFVLDQLPAPASDAQREMRHVYDSEGLCCASIILEGTGFWASGIRSMTNNVHRSTTGSVVLRVNTSIEETISWLAPVHQQRTGVALPSDDFWRALSYVREYGAARARGGGG